VRRRALPLGAAVAAAAAWTAPGPARAQQPVFPAAAQVVTIDAVVVDRDGRPVSGLSRADFEVEEDGERQALTHFETVAVPPRGASAPPDPGAPTVVVSSSDAVPRLAPRSFVVVYDDLHVAPARATAAREAVRSFLEREVRAGERVAVVVTGSGAWWTAEAPRGVPDLLAFLEGQPAGRSRRAVEEMTDVEAQRIAEHDDVGVRERVVDRWVSQGRCQDLCEFVSPCDPREGRRACSEQVRAEALQRNDAARHGLRRTLATMAAALAGIAAERGRKALVLVSEGFLFDPGIPAYREVVQASLLANAAIHFLDVRGLEASSPLADVGQRGDFAGAARAVSEESQLGAAGAELVAEDSGGLAIRKGNDLEASLARVAREAEVYYLLGYEPPPRPGRAGFRKVSVRVRRAGVEVRARRGYYVDAAGRVDSPGGGPHPETARKGSPREPLRPVLAPRSGLRILAAAYVGPPAGRDRTKVRLVAEVDLTSLGAERGEVPLEVRGDVWPRNGSQWVGLDRKVKVEARPVSAAPAWHLLTWDVALPPGVYQARLVFRDGTGSREGSLTHRFEVPEPKGLRFASPVVTDVVRRDGGGGPSLVAGASRSFATGPGRSLYVQLELLGVPAPSPGRPGVTARVRLRDEAGHEVRAVPPGAVQPDPAGRLVRALGFSLDDVAPGRYALSLEGRDERTGATCAYEESLVLTGDDPHVSGREPRR
jgi:VWFA-related protein